MRPRAWRSPTRQRRRAPWPSVRLRGFQTSARGFTGLWRQPDFLKFWSASAISDMGSQVSALALPLIAALTLSATSWQMGLLSAAGSAPTLLVGLFAGVWVDRLRRRPALIAVDLGRAALLLAIPLASVAGVLRIEILFGFLWLLLSPVRALRTPPAPGEHGEPRAVAVERAPMI